MSDDLTSTDYDDNDVPPTDDGHAEVLPRIWKATELQPATQPRWLAKGRLPRAAVSLLVGDEGIGKSLLWVWLTAAITRGRPLAEFGIPRRDPAPVLIVCTEDDWSTTVLPRLIVADADLDMVSVICTEPDGSGAPLFPRDIYLITEADPRPALVVVDAWLDTVSGTLSVKDPQQARRALHPWKDAATVTDAAVLLLTHTNRVQTGNARDKYGATGELRKKARLTLYAQQDEDGYLVVGPEKANTTAPIAASRFTIDPVQHFQPSEDHDGTVPLLRYVDDSDRTSRELIADAYTGDGDDDQSAVDIVRQYLTECGGSAPAADVLKHTRAAGLTDNSVKKARGRKSSGIRTERVGFGKGAAWHWSIDSPIDSIDTHVSDTGTNGTYGESMGTGLAWESPADDQAGPSGISTLSTLSTLCAVCGLGPLDDEDGRTGHHAMCTLPPGGLTPDSPGQTDRVRAALAKAQEAAR